MNRSEVLARGLEVAEMSQSDLARYSGVPQSKISRYVNGRLEPSEPVLRRLLDAMGVEVSLDVHRVAMERTKRRSWMLHRELARSVGPRMDLAWWDRIAINLDQVRSSVSGRPHEDMVAAWQEIIDAHDLTRLKEVLLDPGPEGIEMREVSPMRGLISSDDRLRVLEDLAR